jgi:hypothetical protein
MARTSFILSAILWQEQVLFCHLYYGKNKFYFVSYIIAGTNIADKIKLVPAIL